MESERKRKLMEALILERNRFSEKGLATKEHEIAIQYLSEGSTIYNPDDWELLDAVMNDFDTTYSDYIN